MKRREFIKLNTNLLIGAGLVSTAPALCGVINTDKLFFKISLAQWSLHRSIRSGKINAIDFPEIAKKEFDINAVEYVNQFFIDKAEDKNYLNELNAKARDNNVKNVLIMIDAEGDLGDSDKNRRMQAVENHYKWVDAARFLGCSSIRVNASGDGTEEQVAGNVVESLHVLSSYAKSQNINVLVENHGSYSSNGKWLVDVIEKVGLDNCGTLPDFGNFYNFDKYKGVQLMMPYAKGVSAKTNSFDDNGNETGIDYRRMLRIVKNSGYNGYIGIEYEGENTDEYAGIRATKELLFMTANEI